MAETRPEPFAKRAALARGATGPGPAGQHLISVPASAVPIFVFLHIPKTAGTTMRGLFNEMFGGYFHLFTAEHDEKRAANGKRVFEQPGYFDNIMLLAGHFHRTHAVVNAISGRRIVFISVMRDPVKRVVSHYDYVRRMKRHRLHAEVENRTLFQAFSGPGQFRKVCENEQLRIMFGPHFDTGIDDALRTNNYVIGTLDHLLDVSRIVSSLSGMPPVPEMPSYNRIEDLGGKSIVRAHEQPDFTQALELIRSVNAAEYRLYDRISERMVCTLPDWFGALPATAVAVAATPRTKASPAARKSVKAG
jgi:hypothetical protein